MSRQGQARRHRGGQLGDRLRRPQRAVPGHGAQHRRRWRRRPTATSPSCWRLTYPGKSVTVERSRQGDGRHHRREHERAPHGDTSPSATASSPTTCTTRSPTASARSACWWRSRARATSRRCSRFGRQLAMHIAAAQPVAARQPTSSIPAADRARARDLHRAGQGLGQAAEDRSPRWWKAGCARSSTQR